MSEFQYYEFRALDRSLTQREMRELRAISTRAEITPASFVNTYEWGDLKGDPNRFMEKYFDAFVYVSNWGTREFMLRLPEKTIDRRTIAAYCRGDNLDARWVNHFLILRFFREGENGDDWDDGGGWMSSLITLRADLMRDDMRSLYLGWLLCAQYEAFDEEELEPPEDTLRKKFGPDTKLLIDQILVTQGGVTAARAARAQNPISGGVVKPVEQNAPFDFKESSVKTLEFVQRELDALLAGTAIQREAAPEIILAPSTPLLLRLQLVSPEPLNSQTISVLASQLASKLGLAIQLHGQVELRAPSFRLTLTPAKPNLGLSADDRAAFRKVIKRAQEDNLRLQVTYTSGRGAGGDKTIPRLVYEVRPLLSQSGLKNSQWTIGVEPPSESDSRVSRESATSPTGADGKSPPTIVAGKFHCALKSFQDF